MGTCCSRSSGGASSASIPAEAPAQVVWDTFLDLDATPEYMSHVKAIRRERPNSNNKDAIAVGTRWQETRVYWGYETVVYNTVVELDPGKRMRTGSSFSYGVGLDHALNSSTLELIPIDATSCHIVMTFGFQPDSSFVGDVHGILCRPCLRRRGESIIRDELADLAAEAERRYKQQRPQRSNECVSE